MCSCCCSVTKLWLTLCDPHGLQHTQASPSFTISVSLLKLVSIGVCYLVNRNNL